MSGADFHCTEIQLIDHVRRNLPALKWAGTWLASMNCTELSVATCFLYHVAFVGCLKFMQQQQQQTFHANIPMHRCILWMGGLYRVCFLGKKFRIWQSALSVFVRCHR